MNINFISFPNSGLFTEFLTGITRQAPLVQKELLTVLEHMR